jgi:hypothetical protein
MIQMLLNPDPQARVLMALKRHAEAFGDDTPDGVRLHGSAADLAREVGVVVEQVRDVLKRLGRMRIAAEDETGAVLVMDQPRLMEFLEFLEMPQKFGV